MKILIWACHYLWKDKIYTEEVRFPEPKLLIYHEKHNIIGNWLIKEIKKESTFKKFLVLLFSAHYRLPVNVAAYTDYSEKTGKIFVYIKNNSNDLFSIDEKVLCLNLIKNESIEYITPEYPKTSYVSKA